MPQKVISDSGFDHDSLQKLLEQILICKIIKLVGKKSLSPLNYLVVLV